MIPKKVFYVWSLSEDKFFDVRSQNQTAKVARICYLSWQQHLGDFDIIELNEESFDFEKHRARSKFFDTCIEHKLWAFASDYIRVHALYESGGIYLDTDVQVLKSMADMVNEDGFISLQHWKYDGKYVTEPAIMGFKPKHPILKKCIDFYDNDFWDSKANTLPQVFQLVLKELYGFEGTITQVLSRKDVHVGKEASLFPDEYFRQKIIELEDLKIYPEQYFCPKWLTNDDNTEAPGYKAITDKTYCIHWNNSSWLEPKKLELLDKYIRHQ